MSNEGKSLNRELSRRRFLRVSGTLAGLAAVGSLAACGDPTATPAPATTAAPKATTAASAVTTAAGSATTVSSATTTAAAGSATTAAAGAQSFAGRTLTVFVYSGLTENTYRDVFAPPFEKMTGAKVVLSPGWWDGAAKLKTSPDDQPPFDLVLTDPTQGFPGIRDGLFQKIDMSKVPNAKNFAPSILDSYIYKDGWGLPYLSSAMSLCWNKELIPGGLKKWSDLFSEGLKGKIMMYNSYYLSLYTFAVAKVEMDGKPGTAKQEMENNLDGVIQFAKDKSAWVGYWWPTTADAVNALLQKNVSAGNIHGNGMIAPLRDGKPVDFIVPENDQAFVELFLLVPRTSKNADLATAAINYFASEDNQRAFGLKTGELSVNIPSVAAEVAKVQPLWAKVYPNTADQFKALNYYPYEFYDKNADKIQKAWDREILRKA
jgi:spermidine/putrescine-binding protein